MYKIVLHVARYWLYVGGQNMSYHVQLRENLKVMRTQSRRNITDLFIRS